MTTEVVAPYAIAAVLVIKEVYSFFGAGRKFDKDIDKTIDAKIAAAMASVEKDVLHTSQNLTLKIEHLTETMELLGVFLKDAMSRFDANMATRQEVSHLQMRIDAAEVAIRGLELDITRLKDNCEHHGHPLRETHGIKRGTNA